VERLNKILSFEDQQPGFQINGSYLPLLFKRLGENGPTNYPIYIYVLLTCIIYIVCMIHGYMVVGEGAHEDGFIVTDSLYGVVCVGTF